MFREAVDLSCGAVHGLACAVRCGHVILALSALEAHDGNLVGGGRAIGVRDEAVMLFELLGKTLSTGTVAGLALLDRE